MAFQGASSSSTHQRPYDVFLSFRGKDTGTNFTAHLCSALRQKGIYTFMDDHLSGGEEISSTLFKAIEESKVSIIVFSQNYASSAWCLDELMEILDCKDTKGQIVVPVFYKVDPSAERQQRNSIGEAFAKLAERFQDNQMKVQKWMTALTQVLKLSGLHLENGNEAEFIHEIIERLNLILYHISYPVGIESRVQDVKSLLDIEENNNTCMVGIFGTGGIGKTTIIKAIYNSVASQFDGSCFLEDVRETFSRKDGLIHLQNNLLSMIPGGSGLMVDNVDQGITLIKEKLCNVRVLLVLDDVDQLIQLEKLVGKGDWFGLGSRIIIATRDKYLLTAHGIDSTYQVNELDHKEALQLFSWHAFNRDRPYYDYVEVTEDALRYSGGLPLALTVLGSILHAKDKLYWKIKLGEYKRIPNVHIQHKLRISYDGLDENAKNIFLHIACFFNGEKVEYVTKILDSCGFHSYSGIERLKDKCLITQSCGLLVMHDLLQQMGREIVRQESPNKPGNRSRLWFHEDVRHVLEENTGTNNVEGILIDFPEANLIHMSSKALMEMKRLKLFICRNVRFSEEINFLPNELRLLYWPEYSGESLPSNFCGKNLVVLRMPHSHLKGLEGVENFQNLTMMNFTDCEFLKKVPDVSRIPNLETLTLDGCENLLEVHASIGFHDKLVHLSLENCYNLRTFPRSLKLRSLESLVLFGCSRLKNFPEIEYQMECLEHIDFQYTGIEKLPSSIGYLIGVKKFYLASCTNLTSLPDSIYQLQNLEHLNLKGCTSIKRLPSSIGSLVRVKTLDLGGCTNLVNLPNSIYLLQHLEQLDLKGCSKLVKFPDNRQSMPSISSPKEYEISSGTEFSPLFLDSDVCSSISFPKLQRLDLRNCALSKSNFFWTFDCGPALNRLDLSGSDVITLPPCIKRFVGLKFLCLNECKQLQEILGFPPNVVEVYSRGCVSLAILLEEPRKSQLFNTLDPPKRVGVGTVFPALQQLSLGNSVGTESEDCPLILEYLDLSSSAIVSLPTWFNKFVGLECLNLEDCKQLREISELPPNIGVIYAQGCTSLERFQSSNIYDLPTLGWIDLSNCLELRENMGKDLQIRLLSEGYPMDHKFVCIFPGNEIPDWFSYSKEFFTSNSCKIDINEPGHLDGEITRIAFSAVIGTEANISDVDEITEGGQDEGAYGIIFEVICDGVEIYSYVKEDITGQFHSDHVWLHYNVPESFKLKGDNLRVKFKLRSASMFFKSCGFHLVHRYKEKAADLVDDVDLMGFEGVEHFQNLRTIDITYCKFLKTIPDVSRIPNLETLTLDSCENLMEVHHSVGFHDKLVRLSLKNCYNLRSFPRSLKLRSLQFLVLFGCSRLKSFPEIECQMECLEHIDFQYTGIEKLPSSIEYLIGVKKLYLAGCKNLTSLPNSICQLQNLECLELKGCTSIKRLPSSVGSLVRVKTLDLGGCSNLTNLPNSVYLLQHLEQLDLGGCSKLVKFPDNRQSMPSIASPNDISSGVELVSLSLDSYDVCSSISFPKLQQLDLSNCALSKSNFFWTFDCGFVLKRLDLSGSDVITLPPCIKRFVGLKSLFLNECKQLQEILGFPPNVVEVYARGCVSLAILLEEPVGSGTLFPKQQSSNLVNSVVTESDCPPTLEYLDLSSSAIVSLPTWFNKFVGLKCLILEDCKQLREISKLPSKIEEVYAHGCTSLERFQSNNIYDLPTLGWIDLSDCHELSENMGNDLQILLLSEGHPKDYDQFVFMFPGNKIPDWFSHSIEVINSNSCVMAIDEPAHLDGEVTRIALCVVIGTKAYISDGQDEIIKGGQDEDAYGILFQVINDGVEIYSYVKEDIHGQFHSDNVWLHYNVPESFKLKGENLRVKFKLRSVSMFFKSCGFHLVRRYEEKAVDFMDGFKLSKRRRDDDDGNLESNWYQQQKRNSSTLGIKISGAADMPLG